MYYAADIPLSNTEQQHLKRALAVASTSTERMRHGCVLADGKRVISVGVNRRRNDPLACSDPPSQAGTHAEVASVNALRGDVDWRRVTLYSVRLNKAGEPALAKPCTRCQAVIDFLGIRRVIHT